MGCFAILRQIRSICWSLLFTVRHSLIVSLVLSRLDYSNVTLAVIPVYRMRCLQSVLNAVASSVTICHARNTSEHCSLVYTGFGRLNEYTSNRRLWCSSAYMHTPRYLSAYVYRVNDKPSRLTRSFSEML